MAFDRSVSQTIICEEYMRKRTKAAVIALGALLGSSLFGCAQAPTPTIPVDGSESHCVTYPLPEDGSTPLDHSGLENIGYMAGRLAASDNYHVEATSDVSAKIIIDYHQAVETIKDYRDGVMVSTDISKSSLVNTASQVCFMDGNALMRRPKSSSASDWNGSDTEWKTETPLKYDYESYLPLYGLFGTEFSVYVINEETLLSASEVTALGDGLYLQTFSFDTELAAVYYRARMKTMGGLAELPDIHSIEATYVFTEEWQVVSSVYTEHYGIKLNALIRTDNCTAVTEAYYSYGNADMRAYDEFFADYRDAEIEPPAPEPDPKPTASDYLMNAFAPVLAGETAYDIRLTLGETELHMTLGVNLPEKKGVLALDNLLLGYADGKALVSYRDLYGSVPLETLKALLPADLGSGISFDASQLIEQLGQGLLCEGEKECSLSTELSFGELVLPIVFRFSAGEEISLLSVEAELPLEGEVAHIVLTPASSVPSLPDEAPADLTAYADQIVSLVKADSHTVHIGYGSGELSLSADLVIKDGICGNFDVVYADYRMEGSLALQADIVYLSLNRFNGEDMRLKVKCGLDSLTTALGQTLPFASEQDALALGGILKGLVSVNYDEAIRSLSLTEEGIAMTLCADPLLEAIGLKAAIGDVSLLLSGDALEASVSGVRIRLTVGGTPQLPEGDYVSLDALAENADALVSLVEKKNYYITLGGSMQYEGRSYPIKGQAKLYAEGGEWRYVIDVSAARKQVVLAYEGDIVKLALPDLNVQYVGKLQETEHLLSVLFAKMDVGAETGAAIDLAKLVSKLTVFAGEDTLLGIRMNLDALCEGLELNAEITREGLTLKSTDVSLGGVLFEALSLSLTDGTEKSVKYRDCENWFYSGDVFAVLSFVGSDAYALTAEAEGISAQATIARDGRIGGKLSVRGLELNFYYADETIYLSAGNLRVKASVSALAEALEAIVPNTADKEISADLIQGILDLDLRDIEIGSDEAGLTAYVHTAALLRAFGAEVTLPDVALGIDFAEERLYAEIAGVKIDVRTSGEEPELPAGEYASVDEVLEALSSAIAIEASADFGAGEANAEVRLEGEIVLRDLLVRGVLTVKIDRSIIYGTFETDGEEIRVSLGKFGVCLTLKELSELAKDAEETYRSVLHSLEQMPDGSQKTVEKINAFLSSLMALAEFDFGSLDELKDFSGIDEEELLHKAANCLLSGSVVERGGKVILTTGAISFGELFSADKLIVAFSGAEAGDILSNPYFEAGKDADYWTKDEIDTLLAGVAGTAELVKNEYFTLGFAFEVYNDGADYEASGGLRFTANGELRLYTGEDFFLSVNLALDAQNEVKDGDLYMQLIIYDGDRDGENDIYLACSKYASDDARYQPLKLQIGVNETSELISALLRLLDIDFPLFDGADGDFLARLDAFRTGGLNLSGLLDSLLFGILETGSDVSGTVGEIRLDDVLNDYLTSLTLDDSTVTVKLNSEKIFGRNGLADLEGYLSLDDANALSAFGLNNLYLFSEVTERVNAAFTADCGAFDRSVPADLDNYIDANGVMNMLSMLVSSATHAENGAYALNERFLVEGTASMSILSYDVSVNIGMQVEWLEEGGMLLHLRFRTEAKNLLGVVLINGDTVTDLTIKVPADGEPTVTMRREQTSHFVRYVIWTSEEPLTPSEVIYRSMPLDSLLDDILNQLGFVLNLGDTILDLMNQDSGDSAESSEDYGNYLIAFANERESYRLVLNGGNLTGGVLGDLELELCHDGKVLRGLNVSTSIYSILKLNGAFSLLNPGEEHAFGKDGLTKDVWDETVRAFGNLYDPRSAIEGKAYLVSFLVDGAEVAQARYIPGSEADLAPATEGFEKIGHTAIGWEPALSSVTGHASLSLSYAPNEYTVTLASPYEAEGFVWQNGRYEKQLSYLYGTALPLPDANVTDGRHRFDGWRLDGGKVSEIRDIASDVTVELIGVEYVSIELVSRFALPECGVYRIDLGETFVLPEVACIADGNYKFRSWTIDGVEVASLVAERDLTVEALWYDPVFFSFASEFALDGFALSGDVWTLQESAPYGETFVLPDRVGATFGTHTFGGWYVGGERAESEYVAERDMRFVAVWKNSVAVVYRSEKPLSGFVRNGSAYEKTVYVPQGERYEAESADWRDETGLIFAAWTLEGADVVSFEPEKDVVLTARFDYVSLTLSLSLNGVSADMTEGERTFCKDYALPLPSSASHEFLGWWYQGENGWTKAESALDADGTTLTAMWIGKEVSLRVDASKRGWLIYKISAKLTASVSVSEQIRDQVSLAYRYEWTADKNASAPASFESVQQGESEISVEKRADRNTWYVHARVTVTYAIGEQSGSLASATVSDRG